MKYAKFGLNRRRLSFEFEGARSGSRSSPTAWGCYSLLRVFGKRCELCVVWRARRAILCVRFFACFERATYGLVCFSCRVQNSAKNAP